MWPDHGESPSVEHAGREALAELRMQSLRWLLIFAAAGHFLWNTLLTATSPYDVTVKAWLLFPLVLGGELLCYQLLRRGRSVAVTFFVWWALLCLGVTTLLFPGPGVLLLYPLLALAAAVTLHPPAAVAVVLVEGLWLTVLQPAPLLPTMVASALTVVVAWTLLRSLDVAVAWWLTSYEQAQRHLADAREHRGRLVGVVSQLDAAYYRLQRSNASLAEAWRVADQAERARADFITAISHELRTPLNLIAGFSEMMLSAPETYGAQPLPGEYRGDLHAIYRSAQHLLAVADDILDLAQAEVSRLALIKEPTDLNVVAEEAAALVRDYVESKGLQLELRPAQQLALLQLDGLRIRQVLLNLLTNAAHFTERGVIRVSISLQGNNVLVSVSDNGPGLTPEQCVHIFEEFQHLDERAARDHRSTGVGLPLSKRFVELHGGHMWVESAPGEGATFRFTLPLAESPTSSATPERSGRLPPGRKAPPALVLAGADALLQRLVQQRFGNHRVLAAADAQQATRMAQDAQAVAILCDLAANATDDIVPVISCRLPHSEQLRQTFGVAGYLVKPVTRAALQAAIARLAPPPQSILLVDDDVRFVRLLSRMLQASGRAYTLLGAHNGQEALEVLQAKHPDLVILDMVMPELSGSEVLRTMADDPGLVDTPVIVVSGQGLQLEEQQVAGDLHIHKPDGFQIRELLNVIEATLGELTPPRAYLPSKGRAPQAGRTDVPASERSHPPRAPTPTVPL